MLNVNRLYESEVIDLPNTDNADAEQEDDSLATSQGIVNALLISVALWTILGLAVWWIV